MKVSVFFPAYNEEGNIERVVRRAVEVAGGLFEDFEIIIVNDGSTDQTGEIADGLSVENPRIRVIHHPQNLGYGGALKSGLYHARCDWICYTDADGQFDFSEITRFLPHTQKADLIIGYRQGRSDTLARTVNSKLWGLLVFLLFGLRVKDRACGFKLIKKKVLKTIPKLESDGAVTEDELLVKAKKAGFKFAEVGVSHHPRRAGKQTGANPKVILTAFREIFKLWRRLTFSAILGSERCLS